MILLDDLHPALLNAIERLISGENVVPHTAVKDFDGTELLVTFAKPSESSAEEAAREGTDAEKEAIERRNVVITITLCHTVPLKVLDAFGNFEAVMRALLPSTANLTFPARSGSSSSQPRAAVTLTIPPLTADDLRSQLTQRFSQLRTLSFVPLFRHQFDAFLKQPESVTPVRVPYHPGESMYLYSSRGNFVCLFSIAVEGKDESVFTRNFLQTFQDAKRLQKEIAAAPGFMFTQQKAPAELPSGLGVDSEGEQVFWCQFLLFKSHMEGKSAYTEKIVTQLINFRNYLMYHIHCCRSYMHALMRKRVETSLQVLGRAKTATTGRSKVVIK